MKDIIPSGYKRTIATRHKPVPFKVRVALKPGCIAIFPVKFIFIEKKDTSGNFSGASDFAKIDKEEKKQVLQRLKNGQETFSLWCNEFNIK